MRNLLLALSGLVMAGHAGEAIAASVGFGIQPSAQAAEAGRVFEIPGLRITQGKTTIVPSGQNTGPLAATTTYTLRCTSAASPNVLAETKATVSVGEREVPVAQPLRSEAEPEFKRFQAVPTVVGRGQSSELKWEVRNAKRCTLSGGRWNNTPVSTISGARDTQAFLFSDGRIAVDGGDGYSLWSDLATIQSRPDYDSTAWIKRTPQGPANYDLKSAIELSRGHILSLRSGTSRRRDGTYEVRQWRSTDNWQTIGSESGIIDVPLAVSLTTDRGERKPNTGLRMHHGLIRLSSGTLLATMYGTYAGDTALIEGGDQACRDMFARTNSRKMRTIVVSSNDEGKTWGNPVTLADLSMLADPAMVTEGFAEADLLQAANGDVIAVMRTGGQNSGCSGYRQTPLYLSRSSDAGATWTRPVPITPRGSNPNLALLNNGVIVLTYGGARTRSDPQGMGGYIEFSDDHGATWKGRLGLTRSNAYTDIVVTGPETVLVFYNHSGRNEIVGTFFTVQRRNRPGVDQNRRL